jgi:hypothetical protein
MLLPLHYLNIPCRARDYFNSAYPLGQGTEVSQWVV